MIFYKFRFSILLLFLCILQTSVYSYSADPNWPCIQRKVETVSIVQMWQGKVHKDLSEEIFNDAAVNETASKLSNILLSENEVSKIISDYEKKINLDKNRENKLNALFLLTFDNLEYLRRRTMQRIVVTVKQQHKLRKELDDLYKKMVGLQNGNTANNDLQNISSEYRWKLLAFTDREELIPYMCERPVFYGKRIYFISKKVINYINVNL